ncbi:hypothetical protein GCM10009128_12750 [Psychrosphaera haliotis]|uniref:hypothetical protein n=1 Tax=Psychrosphaera haliotis TaxID=555083 RepID=UPI0031D66D28
MKQVLKPIVVIVLLIILNYFIASGDLMTLSVFCLTLWALLSHLLSVETKQKLISSRLSIKHDLELHEHGIFWIPIFFFSFLALWVGLFSTEFNPNLIFTNPLIIVNSLKVPVTIFALCIPFTVAIGRFHGSAQRLYANQQAEAVKSFKHYFDHREAFKQHILERLEQKNRDENLLEIGNIPELYKTVFPKASVHNFDITPSAQTKLNLEAIIQNIKTEKEAFLELNCSCEDSKIHTIETLSQTVQLHFSSLLKDTGLKLKGANSPSTNTAFHLSGPEFATRMAYELQNIFTWAGEFAGDQETIANCQIIPDNLRIKDENDYISCLIDLIVFIEKNQQTERAEFMNNLAEQFNQL